MMLLNSVLTFSLNGANVFIEIILLLSYLECSGPTLTMPLLYHHPPLRLHPFVGFQSPHLIQRCKLFNNCGDQDQNYFGIHDTQNFHSTYNDRKESLSIGQQTLAAIYTSFPTTIRPTTQSIINDNYSVKPVTLVSNVLHQPIHSSHSSHLNTLFKNLLTKSSNRVSDLKELRANKLLSTKRHIYETRKFEPHDNTLFTNGVKEKVTNNLLENILKMKSKAKPSTQHRQMSLLNEFKNGLDIFERKFYSVTLKKLTAMTAGGLRAENSISFVQSALFLQLLLLALSIDRNTDTKANIDSCIGIEKNISDAERIQIIKEVVSMLPNSTEGLVFRWSSRLVLNPWWWYNISETFRDGAAALQLHMNQFNGTETPQMLSAVLNRMVEEDSKGAIHNTFDPDDLSGTVRAVFLTTLYLRSSWRTAPTLLNETRIFRDSYEDPNRTIRMIRVNDMMRYAKLTECDAEVLEVFYLKPGLSLLMLVPNGPSLRNLAGYVAEVGLSHITSRMGTLRVAADLPLYTLRMSLLLPNKLVDLGLSDILHADNTTDNELKMSHGLQRLMFWAEAGRNAFKDDGLEWDESPHMKIVIDRPYLFFVRWNNMTLMNGNFVL